MQRRAFLSGILASSLLPFTHAFSQSPASPLYRPDANIIRINYYHQWQPVSFVRQDGKTQGVLINILDAVLHEKMDLSVVHKGLPWKRAQYEVEMAQADALCAFPSKKRKEYLSFSSESVLELEMVFFCRKESRGNEIIRASNGFGDLSSLTFGELLANDWAKEKLKDHDKVFFAPNQEELMKALVRRRIDVVMIPDLIGEYMRLQMPEADQIAYVRKSYIGRLMPLYLGIRKDYPNVHKVLLSFDWAMKEFKASGARQDTIDRYMSM